MRVKTFGQLFEALVHVPGTQYGSNPGGVAMDDETGAKHYSKTYANPDQAKAEVLAAKIHGLMGIHGVDPEERNGTVTSRWNRHLKPLSEDDFRRLDPRQQHQIGRMFAAAVLTKNHDVVGDKLDNVVAHRKTGDLHSLDHGGAFHFRPNGEEKSYGPDIAEHDSLRNRPGNASSFVFNTVFRQNPDAEHEGYKAVKHLDDAKVRKHFEDSGLHNWMDLHSNFMARKGKFLDRYEGSKDCC